VALTKGVRIEKAERLGLWKNRGAYKQALMEAEIASKWHDEHERVFVTLKIVLTSDQVLAALVYDGHPFIVGTDALSKAFSAFLAQEHGNAKGRVAIHPITFVSRQTTDAKSRYHPFVGELAAIKWLFNKFATYVAGGPIILESDACAVLDFLEKEHLPPAHARWKEVVLGHEIVEVHHRPGISNPMDSPTCKGMSAPISTEAVDPGWEAETGMINNLYLLNESTDAERTELDIWLTEHTPEATLLLLDDQEAKDLFECFAEDTFFLPIVQLLRGCPPKEWTSLERGRYCALALWFFAEDWFLWKVTTAGTTGRVECVTEEELLDLIHKEYAERRHMSRDFIMGELSKRVFRPGMQRAITEAIQTCQRCVQFGPKVISALLQPVVRSRLFERICLDYLSMPTGKGGYKTILLAVDWFTRWIWAWKSRKAGTGALTVEALKFIKEWYALMEWIFVDGGLHFTNDEVHGWCTRNGVEFHQSPEYALWDNGLIKVENHILLDHLR
jgi:hypothetical protein